MLVNCPKCGLSQPQDRFCARCGVDMETYKPKEASSFSKLLLSPLFQIGLVLTFSGAVATYIVAPKGFELLAPRQHKFLTKDTASKATQESPSGETAKNNPPETSSQTLPMGSEATSKAGATLPSGGGPATNSDNELATAAKDSADKAQKVGSASPNSASLAASGLTAASVGLRVTYALIDTAFMNRIFEESQATGQFATFASYVAGLLPDIEKKIAPANARIKILHKVEKRVEEGKAVSWYLGTKTPEGDDDLGLTTSIEYKELDRGIFRGTFMIQRQWREKTFYPAEVELPPQNGFFIAGVLPRNIPEGSTSNIATQSPFDVLKDPSFRSRSSEFVIFLELTK